MTPEEERERQSWLRGTLPSWLVLFLLLFVGWGTKQAFDSFQATFNRALDRIERHEVRISVLENATGVRAGTSKDPNFGQVK